MCGIVGIVHRDPARPFSLTRLDAMTDRMRHRGPDDRGVAVHPPVAFGHRRLSIIDLAGAAQPMRGPQGDLLTYNGEIYNYVELRDQRLAGAVPATAGDTETLLHLLGRDGADVLPHLNGMFAFGYWHPGRREALLARDPMGQKPLLYFMNDEVLVFASELTALAAHEDVPKDLDPEALARYLAFEAYPAPHTPLRGVRKLRPGHALRLDQGRWTVREWRYWDLGARTRGVAVPGTYAARLERLDELIMASVRRHMRADVPVGFFLSGGYDSNTFVAAAARLVGGGGVRTYTIRNTEASFDESEDAAATARHFGTRHQVRPLRPEDFLAVAPRIAAELDEPLADPGLLAKSQVCAFAREDLKVVLSGDGGDEFFAGYAPFRAIRAARALQAAVPRAVLRRFARWGERVPAQYEYMGFWFRVGRFARGLPHPWPEMLQRWIGSFTEVETAAVLRGGAGLPVLRVDPALGFAPLWEDLHRADAETSGQDVIARTAHFFQSFYLPYCICAHADKASMRVSLELRAPFLDTELMAYANALPSGDKYGGGRTKRILGDWLARHGAPGVVGRRKRGFTVPLAIWFRGPLREWLGDLLSPATLARTGLFEPAAVAALLEEHWNGRANNYKKLWTLAMFQQWHLGTFQAWRRAAAPEAGAASPAAVPGGRP